MDERTIRFRVGVMVTSAILLGGILAGLLGGVQDWFRPTITVYVGFVTAPGVTVDTPVRKSGILIGRVTGVRWADEVAPLKFPPDVQVVLTLKIDSTAKVRKDEVCRISSGLLGDAVLQFVPSSVAKPSRTLLQDGDAVVGVVAQDPLAALSNLEGNLSGATQSVSRAGDQITELAERLNRMLGGNEEQFGRIVDKTERTLDSMQQALTNMDRLLGDEKLQDDLRTSIAELPKFLQETRDAIGGFKSTIELAERNLQNLEGFTGPLGERGQELVIKVDRTVGRLDELLAQFVDFGKALNQSEGTLGQLIHNPDLYQHLDAAARDIQQITCKLRPIVADARVFMDKVSRHPEVLGVRGALQPSSGTKWGASGIPPR